MMQSKLHEPALTIAEAAQRLSVPERTVRRMITAGELPAFRSRLRHKIDTGKIAQKPRVLYHSG